MVARLLREQEVAGSNPVAPTIFSRAVVAGAGMGVTGLRSAAEIVVEGRVQGVGYRDYVQRKGASLGLCG